MFDLVIVKEHDNIVKTLKICAYKYNVTFDADVFHDTYIRCNKILQEKNFTKEEMIRYYWVSYINNIKKSFRDNKRSPKFITIDEKDYNIPNETNVENNTDIIYEIIKKEVINKYGEKTFTMWKLHFGEGKTYDDLVKMGYVDVNFHNLFRSVNRYLKNNVLKHNLQLNKLLSSETFDEI